MSTGTTENDTNGELGQPTPKTLNVEENLRKFLIDFAVTYAVAMGDLGAVIGITNEAEQTIKALIQNRIKEELEAILKKSSRLVVPASIIEDRIKELNNAGRS